MFKYIVLSVFCYAFTYSFVMESEKNPVVGYYWKEFNGVIPKNAVPGGINRNGSITYIGRVYHRNLVIPTKIDLDNNSMSYEWGYKEHFVTKDVNILCADNLEQFKWLSSANGLFHELKGKHIVIGGYEYDADIYIGRIQLDDELSLGKIIHGSKQTTLNTVRDGIGSQHAVFQVLVYNPAVPFKTVTCKSSSIVINLY